MPEKKQCTSLRCGKEGMKRNPGQPFLYPLKQCERACAEGSPFCATCIKQVNDPEKWHGATTNSALPPYSRGYFPEGSPFSHMGRSNYNLKTTAAALEKAEKEAAKAAAAAAKEIEKAEREAAKAAEKAAKVTLRETKKATNAAVKASNLADRMARAGGGGPSQTRRRGLVPAPAIRGGLAVPWHGKTRSRLERLARGPTTTSSSNREGLGAPRYNNPALALRNPNWF